MVESVEYGVEQWSRGGYNLRTARFTGAGAREGTGAWQGESEHKFKTINLVKNQF